MAGDFVNLLLRQMREENRKLEKILKEVEELLVKASVFLDINQGDKAKELINTALKKIKERDFYD